MSAVTHGAMASEVLLGTYVLQDPWDGDDDPAIASLSKEIFIRYSHYLRLPPSPELAASYEMICESLDVKTATVLKAGPLKVVYKPFGKISRWLKLFFPGVTERSELASLWHHMENVRFRPRILGTVDDSSTDVQASSSQLDSEASSSLSKLERQISRGNKIQCSLDHPHILKPMVYHLSLERYIKKNGALEERAAVDVMLQVASGIMYMHSFKLVHLDITPENMFVQPNASFPSGLKVQLANFRCSTSLEDGILFGREGTPFYWAPEVSRGVNGRACFFTEKADVYSFAVSFYVVLTGKTPLERYKDFPPELRDTSAFYILWKRKQIVTVDFEAQDLKTLKKLAGKRPPLPLKLSSSLAKLIKQCWHADPEERPSFDVICWALEIIQSNFMGADISSSLSRKPDVYPVKMVSDSLVRSPRPWTGRKLLLASYVLQDPCSRHDDPAIANLSKQIFMRYSHYITLSRSNPGVVTAYDMTCESLDVKIETTFYAGLLKLVYKPFEINDWLRRFFSRATNRSELALLWLQMENVFAIPIGGTVDDILHEFPSVEEKNIKRDMFLAHGAYGAIDKITWSNGKFAMKVFAKEEEFLHEAELHFRLDHPHIVKPHGYVRQLQSNTFGVIMELMDGDLENYIRNRKKLDEVDAVDVMLQVASGLTYMHKFGMIHRDVKPANMLVRFNKSFPSGLEVKLGDFSCARTLDDGNLTTRQGTMFYWAPEVIQGEEGATCSYSEMADVYSFGMSFYAVLTGKTPFEDNFEHLPVGKFYEKIRGGSWIIPGLKKRAGERPLLPGNINSSLAKLIKQCWHDDPEQRPRFDVICWALKIIQCKLMGTEISSALLRFFLIYTRRLSNEARRLRG